MDATPYFGETSPRFLDPGDAAMLEAAVAAARSEAFEEGRRAGRTEAEAAARQVERALHAAVAEIRSLRDASVAEAVELGCAVADIALGEERFLATDTLAERIREGVTSLDDPAVTVAVAPTDIEPVRQLLSGIAGVTLTPDPGIRQGEARIAGSWASLDITKEAALAVAREVLS